ncbi:Hsp20 family protein [bacterium]|jgi:molecular chaperone IbpA|nr:Hsp20 family protein [bacterium]MBT3850058.1 Hsp20 family protein [bacterium]MBT4435405.1 Hsp20 family protein [bacterium]NSW99303.1 Hsp20 family protein [bacterium]|tara:strand:+ start:2686 stop:3123 length:438 start_codon:yes stop_codon:yes gene_type:complete
MRLVKYSTNQLDDLFRLTPYSVGFDSMFDRLLNTPETASGSYPPYDIVKVDSMNYEIRMALAGFTKDDISVKYEEGTVTVESVHENGKSEEVHLVHGISKRKFRRVFTLSEDMIVKAAGLKDGMLSIKLERILPEEKKPRTINIQ